MSATHALYIPAILLLGMVVGWVMGQKSALAQIEKREQRRKQ